MHSKSWLFLTISFLLGLASAFVVAYYTFDAKPLEVYDPGPTVKILVSKREIPRGAEIVADAIVFEDAPVAELPESALTNFSQVYRRRAAYPIPAGFPICDDFLLSRSDSENKENTYLPPGSQIVSLEVEQLRIGDSVSHLQIPITKYLSTEQKIDIRVVPREEPKGVYVQRRQKLLREHLVEGPSSAGGEIVLQDIEVHQIAGEAADEGMRQVQTLSLILDQEDAKKLMTAAKKGTLRVVPHASEFEFPGDTVTADTGNPAPAVAASETEASLETKPETESEETRIESDVVKTEVETIRNEVESIRSEVESIRYEVEARISEFAQSEPEASAEITEKDLVSTDEETTLSLLMRQIVSFSHELGDQWERTLSLIDQAREEEILQQSREEKKDAVVSFVPPTIINSRQGETVVRNEAVVPEHASSKRFAVTAFQFIGSKQENGSTHLVPEYSPFDIRSRLPEQSKKEGSAEETKESDEQEPIRFRNRSKETEASPQPLAERWRPEPL